MSTEPAKGHFERPAGTAPGVNCGAQVAVRHDGQAAVAKCTDHGLGHYDPTLDLSWPAGEGHFERSEHEKES